MRIFNLISITLVLITFLLMNCDVQKNTTVEFIWRKDLRKEQYNAISDYIIIANCPTDSAVLKQLIDNFNDTTNVGNHIFKNGTYLRFFYKESKRTPRDFQEYEDVLGGHRIDYNHSDLMFYFNWDIVEDSVVSYFYYYPSKLKRIQKENRNVRPD